MPRSRPCRLFLHIIALAMLAVANSGSAAAQASASPTPVPADIQANPARPTVSTPATLPPAGFLQFETGGLGAEKSGDFSNRASIESVIKVAITKNMELLLVTEPLVISDRGPTTTIDTGDVSVGVQAVVHQGEGSNPTVALSYFRRLYSGPAPDLDIGSARQSALLLVSFDVKKFHVDTNGIVNEQITDLGGIHRAQFGETLSISRPVIGHLSMAGELWHFSQPLTRSNAAGLLLAPSYSVNRFLVLDGGFNRGLTSTSTRWEAFVGFTYLLPKKMW